MIILIIIASYLCFFLSGVCKSTSDTLADHYNGSIFFYLSPKWFWDKRISYLNKYKDRDIIKGKAKFPGSTTWLVWLTDGWHLSNFLGHLLRFIGIILLSCTSFRLLVDGHIVWINLIYFYILVYVPEGLGFIITYDWLFKKSTWK